LKDTEYNLCVSWCGKKGISWSDSYKNIKECIDMKDGNACKECLHKLILLLRVLENESFTLLT
jgi:DNA-directed RNA polymerase subunit RPC12/RpoP